MSHHDPESRRLVELARSQSIEDPAVAAAWRGFVEALECRWFVPRDLDRIIRAVRERQSVGNEEFFFDFDPPGSNQVISRFISDEYVVPADAIVAELEILRRRFRGEPEPASGPPSGAPAPPDAPSAPAAAGTSGAPVSGAGAASSAGGAAHPPDLASFLTGLLGGPTLAPGAGALNDHLSELGAAVARLVHAMQSNDPAQRQRAAAELAELQRRLGEAGADAARWSQAQQDELARALRKAGGVSVDRLVQGLRVILSWLEQRSPEAGAAVDAMIEGLERSFGRLATPGKQAAQAERDEKLRSDARASIAQRLREAGIKPPGDS